LTRPALFDAIRPFAPGKSFSKPEWIEMVDNLGDAFGLPRLAAARILHDEAAFFRSIRGSLFKTGLTQAQVDGIKTKLVAIGAASMPIAFAAYALATGYWETNRTMQPVREAYWKDEAWRKANLRYWPWYGRGDVQTTWEANYRRADDKLSLGGSLIADPDRMLEPEISAKTMALGMTEGWFTGKKLADYLPAVGFASRAQFVQARRIINGTDKADEVAGFALSFQSALADGGWA